MSHDFVPSGRQTLNKVVVGLLLFSAGHSVGMAKKSSKYSVQSIHVDLLVFIV